MCVCVCVVGGGGGGGCGGGGGAAAAAGSGGAALVVISTKLTFISTQVNMNRWRELNPQLFRLHDKLAPSPL